MGKTLTAVCTFICVYCFSQISLAESHEDIAKKLPSDLAILATLEQPDVVIEEFLSGLGMEPERMREFSELLLLTNPTDGTQRKLKGDDKFDPGLLSAQSFHFVVDNSREKVGDVAIIIDRGDLELTVTVEYAKLYVRLVSQIWNHNYQIRRVPVPFDLQDLLSTWESTLTVVEGEKWLIIATSDSFAKEMKNGLISAPPKSSLATNRNFGNSVAKQFDDAFLSCYMSHRDAKRILIATGYAKEELWDKEALNEIPWVSTSFRLFSDDDQFQIDRKSVMASTSPLQGDRRYWEFYQPIEEFPPIPPTVESVNAKGVKLEEWHQLAKKIYPEVYGKGVYESYESNPLLAFKTGISRPRLGNLKYEIWDHSSGTPQQVILYKVESGTPEDTVLGYLKAYYTAVQDSSKNYYDMNYRLTEVKGLTAWWTDKVDPKSGGGGAGGEGAEDAGSEKGVDKGDLDAKKEDDPKEKVSTAMGAVVIDGWVVAGQEHVVDLVTDFETGSFREQPENICKKAVDAALKRFDFENTHYFEYKTNSAVKQDFNFLNTLLYRAMPVGWAVRNKVFDEAKKDPSVLDKFTRPQKLRFYLETSMEKLTEQKPVYLRVDSFSDRLTRQVFGESWIFKSKKE